jgi:hypothetical protein
MTISAPPRAGERIAFEAGSLRVPDRPIIPFIEGDGTGPDIWRASRLVFDAAVQRAYGGRREIVWREVLAGEKAKTQVDDWLPEATLEVIRSHLVAIKGPLTTPVGWVAPVALLEGGGDEHLHEGQAVALVQVAGPGPGRGVGRDQRDHHQRSRVGHQPGDLGGPAHVLLAGGDVEAQVTAQAVAQVVAVEPVGRHAGLDQAHHQLAGHRRLAGGGKPGEPDRGAAAAEQLEAPVAAERLALPDHALAVRAVDAHRAPPAPMTIPPATVSLVASSTRMKLPVARWRR